MAPLKRLIPSNSNVLLELKRVADVLAKTPNDSLKRLPLLRRQAALGDLRDDIEKRSRRSA
ncbi:MAG: hypothetical protein ACJ762_06995 [Solirubrobacteraceae bacterium]